MIDFELNESQKMIISNLDKNLEELILALDPMKHLIILDTNGWTFDEEKAKWFAAIGGYKVQLSLDSFLKKNMIHSASSQVHTNARFEQSKLLKKLDLNCLFLHVLLKIGFSHRSLMISVSIVILKIFHYMSHLPSQSAAHVVTTNGSVQKMMSII